MSSIPKHRLYLVYPETDGQPMAENTLQFEWIVLIKLGLEACFIDRDDVFVAGDLFWYPVEGKPGIRLAPDVLVALGRPKGHRGSYLQWLENHIAPQVVIEILSPGNRAGEMQRKFEFYQRYGVQEYYVYDPDHNQLEGYLRRGEILTGIPEQALKNWTSPLLGIRLEWTPETLRLYQPNGKRFLSYLELLQEGEKAMAELEEKRRALGKIKARLQEAELRTENANLQAKNATQRAESAEQRAESAEQRAESAEQRAESAEQRAESAEQRAEKLAKRLKELGIDPQDI